MEAFKASFSAAFQSGNLSSWDESSFDMRCRPIYGYAPKGEQAILHVPKPFCEGAHHSLLMATHMKGSTYWKVSTESTTGDKFAEFVRGAPFPPGTVVLLDNHSIHRSPLVRQTASHKGYVLLNTPPYSPQFNPIEMTFGCVKGIFYKERFNEIRPKTAMVDFIGECLSAAATPSAVSGCFRHVFERHVSSEADRA